MSRITYDDYYDGTKTELAWGRWERNSRVCVTSKKGQKILRELRDALLNLPVKELAYEVFWKGDQVCTVGALARHRGVQPPDWWGENADEVDADEVAEWASVKLGVTETLAWLLVELNDETYRNCTPPQRYEKVLSWVNKRISE